MSNLRAVVLIYCQDEYDKNCPFYAEDPIGKNFGCGHCDRKYGTGTLRSGGTRICNNMEAKKQAIEEKRLEIEEYEKGIQNITAG